MSLFRKKPVTVEAIQWTGFNYTDSEQFCGESLAKGVYVAPPLGAAKKIIKTLEGDMTCSPGDWIIRGVKGEVYPCKPDIFEATYEPAQPSDKGEAEKRVLEAALRAFAEQDGSEDFGTRVAQGCRDLAGRVNEYRAIVDKCPKCGWGPLDHLGGVCLDKVEVISPAHPEAEKKEPKP